MTVAGGRVVSRPMNGAIEGMLAVLEDPRAEQADAAVAGPGRSLLSRRPRRAPPLQAAVPQDALRPRSRASAASPPGRWPTPATWTSSPQLIDALTDPDEDVVDAARLGLQIISRKIEGLGPPSPSTPEQRKEAAARWREWYNAIRPLDLDDEGNAHGRRRRRGRSRRGQRAGSGRIAEPAAMSTAGSTPSRLRPATTRSTARREPARGPGRRGRAAGSAASRPTTASPRS